MISAAFGVATAARAEDIDVEGIVAIGRPAVTKIAAYNIWNKPIGAGTGFFVSDDGLLVTCLHVIRGAHKLEIKLSNGSIFTQPEVVASEPGVDLAILRVEGANLSYLSVSTSENARIGDPVVVIGNPQDLEGTVSEGIISNVWERGGLRILQTTAPVSPGSSGGPLVAADGTVIGIVSSQLVEGQNLNFAIAAEELHELYRDSQGDSDSDGAVVEDAQYAFLVGTWAWETGELEAAEASFTEALKLDPKHVSSYISLADMQYEQGEYESQTEILTRGVQAVPDDASLHYNLGIAYEGVGEEDRAVEEYKKALSLNSRHVDSLYNLAFLYILKRSYEEASVVVEQLRPLQGRYAQQLARLIGMLQLGETTRNR